MVALLSPEGRSDLNAAIAEAESQTSAELIVVVAPASDAYQSYVLLYGLILGSLAALILWGAELVLEFPLLLAVQLTVLALLSFVPILRQRCLSFIPSHIGRLRAAQRACEEYALVSRHVPAGAPILLLYVSLAERYAQILPSRIIRASIADSEWESIIQALTASVHTKGLSAACIEAVRKSCALLAPAFPEKTGQITISEQLIERSM